MRCQLGLLLEYQRLQGSCSWISDQENWEPTYHSWDKARFWGNLSEMQSHWDTQHSLLIFLSSKDGAPWKSRQSISEVKGLSKYFSTRPVSCFVMQQKFLINTSHFTEQHVKGTYTEALRFNEINYFPCFILGILK